MSNLLEKIKNLRIQAMKSADKVSRFAYEAVISEASTAQGRGFEITDELVVKTIKKEIIKYQERDKQLGHTGAESLILAALLPEEKPFLTEEMIRKAYADLLVKGKVNPKILMESLDKEVDFQYDKALVARIALGK